MKNEKENLTLNTNPNLLDIFKKKGDRILKFIDEDGYELTHPDDINDFFKRARIYEKEKWLKSQNKIRYELSKWAKEVVTILKNSDGLKNKDIMQELYKIGYDGDALHINQFFKSIDGARFRKDYLINNDGYWSIKN